MSRIFDTHAHYDDEAFDQDRDTLLHSLEAAGIGNVVNVAASVKSCRTTLELAESHPFIYGALGIHPNETAELMEQDMEWLKKASAHEKIVAIGEIGLDYYWNEPDREIQKTWFVRQLQVARETGLPVIIHSRDAARDTLDIMKAEREGITGGVIHCFSYGMEMAREYLNMGYYLGIGGVLTFKNAKNSGKLWSMPLFRRWYWKRTVRIWLRFRGEGNAMIPLICRWWQMHLRRSREFPQRRSYGKRRRMRDAFTG